MILYFSGTGNSQFAALRIAKLLGEDKAVSINRCLKDEEKREFHSELPLVFVAPIYAWRMPRVVEEWIEHTKFEGNKNAYFILTRGGGTGGNAALYTRRLCERTGLTYRGLASVQMPENYIALSSAPSESECEEIMARAEPVFSALAQRIKQGEAFTEAQVSLGGRFLSGRLTRSTIMLPFMTRALPFRTPACPAGSAPGGAAEQHCPGRRETPMERQLHPLHGLYLRLPRRGD